MAAQRFRIAGIGGQVGIGVAGAHYVKIEGIAKPNSDEAPYCVANEYVCAELARYLRLPVPPSGILHAPDHEIKTWFGSMNFNINRDNLPPVNGAECVKELGHLSVGLLLFDVLIANSDRHWKNISVDFEQTPPAMRVFDHSHALFGIVKREGAARLKRMETRLGITATQEQTQGNNRHFLLDCGLDTRMFPHWFERIASIPPFAIEDICRSAVGIGIDELESKTAIEFLSDRRKRIRDLINANRSEFKGIKTWDLFA